jgi:hypothetical protein
MEGADLTIVYFDEHKDAHETKRYVEALGANCLLLPETYGSLPSLLRL